MVFDFEGRASKTSNALNLWDIELRIKKLHGELELLHEAKEQLLEDKDRQVKEWEKDWHDRYQIP